MPRKTERGYRTHQRHRGNRNGLTQTSDNLPTSPKKYAQQQQRMREFPHPLKRGATEFRRSRVRAVKVSGIRHFINLLICLSSSN
jgi:hypothetical protein